MSQTDPTLNRCESCGQFIGFGECEECNPTPDRSHYNSLAEHCDTSMNGMSTKECAAIRLLARDGYDVGTLRFMFQYSKTSPVYHHVRGECAHKHEVHAIPSWDGENAPERLNARDRH